MAKRKASGQAAFNQIVKSIPRCYKGEIIMNADSTVEVYDDIDTNLDDGQAWVLYGMQYVFENIDPTVPLANCWDAAAEDEYVLQLQRGDDSEILLASNARALAMQHRLGASLTTSGAINWVAPFKVAKKTITMQSVLRVLFRTSTDVAAISAATIQLAYQLFYDIIPAPTVANSKLGQWSEL